MSDAMMPAGNQGRDRAIILAAVVAVVAISWLYIVYLAQGMPAVGTSGTETTAPATEQMQLQAWSFVDLVLLFLMWAIMMVGMMLPSAIPLILHFEDETRAKGKNIFLPTTALVLGYVVVWAAFSLLATLAQWGLHSAALLSPMMVSNSATLSGLILVAAGVYQLTPVQYNLLKKCRNPLANLRLNWLEGHWGAFGMGIEHGLYCVGCCLVLMGLLFVFGVMNLLLLAIIALFVLVEKAFPYGHIASLVSGPVLIAIGGYVLLF